MVVSFSSWSLLKSKPGLGRVLKSSSVLRLNYNLRFYLKREASLSYCSSETKGTFFNLLSWMILVLNSCWRLSICCSDNLTLNDNSLFYDYWRAMICLSSLPNRTCSRVIPFYWWHSSLLLLRPFSKMVIRLFKDLIVSSCYLIFSLRVQHLPLYFYTFEVIFWRTNLYYSHYFFFADANS